MPLMTATPFKMKLKTELPPPNISGGTAKSAGLAAALRASRGFLFLLDFLDEETLTLRGAKAGGRSPYRRPPANSGRPPLVGGLHRRR